MRLVIDHCGRPIVADGTDAAGIPGAADASAASATPLSSCRAPTSSRSSRIPTRTRGRSSPPWSRPSRSIAACGDRTGRSCARRTAGLWPAARSAAAGCFRTRTISNGCCGGRRRGCLALRRRESDQRQKTATRENVMRAYRYWSCAAVVASLWTTCVQAQSTVYIPDVVELSGPGAVSGTNWRDGVALAIDEINAVGRHPGPQDRDRASRHPEQSRHLARADPEGSRPRSLCRAGADLFRLGQGQHGADPAGRGAADRRRRGRRHHPAGQPLGVPHRLRPAVQHAEDRQLSARPAEGEDGRAGLGQQ